MATKITLRHPGTGVVKTGFYGYSWTFFLFNFWVPLIRGNMKLAGMYFLLWAVLGIFQVMAEEAAANPQELFSIRIGAFAFNITMFAILAWFFNKQYTHDLLERGYVLQGDDIAARMALGLSQPVVQETVQSVRAAVAPVLATVVSTEDPR